MLLAWGGESMELSFPIYAQRVDKKASRAIEAIHRFEVLHKDAMPRNMLWNEALKRVLFIDFERSQIREVQAGKRVLGIISPNQKKRENDPMQIAKEAGDEKVVSTAGDVSKAAETETIDEILFAHELKEVRWALAEKAAGA